MMDEGLRKFYPVENSVHRGGEQVGVAENCVSLNEGVIA